MYKSVYLSAGDVAICIMAVEDMEVEKRKNHIVEYADIRVIATLLVLLGHGTKIVMAKKCGVFPTFEYGNISEYMEYLRLLIYSFHMPLFFMLSGSVFVIALKKYDAKTWLKKRIRRLMIPFLGLCIFLLIPVRFLVDYYHNYQEPAVSVFVKDYLLGYDLNYLWFTLVSTEISVLILLLRKYLFGYKRSARYLVLGGLLFLSVAQFSIEQLPFQLSSAIRYLFWFYLGACFELDRNILVANLKKHHVFLFVIIWLLAFAGHTALDSLLSKEVYPVSAHMIKLIKMGIRYAMEFCGSMMVYSFVFLRKHKGNGFAKMIDRKSFEIYLYHCPIIWMIQCVYSIILAGKSVNTALYILLLLLQNGLALILSLELDKGLNCLKFLVRKQNNQRR